MYRLIPMGSICLPAILFFVLSCCVPVAKAAMKTEFHPVLYVSGHYTDNENQTKSNKNETHYMVYGSALSLRFVQKNASVDLSYTPEFIDRESNDEDGDSLEHNASIMADIQASPRVDMNLSVNYDGHDNDVDNEAWRTSGDFTTTMAISKKTRGEINLDYANAFDRRKTTGTYREQTDYGGSVVVIHQFGYNNQLSLSLDYSTVDYDPPVDEDYDSWSPGISVSYWMNPCWGMNLSATYEKTTYDILNRDVDSGTGTFRLIRCIDSHFKFYSQYKHIHTNRDGNSENSYLPSLGFDWDVTQDSGVSLGLGYLYQEWENKSNGRFFVDADVFKQVDFSRHANVVLTASSTIYPNSEEGADLGFQIQYRSGFLLNWDIMEALSVNLTTAWTQDEFTEPDVDRTDNILNFSTGLSWSPWCWGTFEFVYSYEDYRTDSHLREDYQEHRGTVTLRIHPSFGWTGKALAPTRESVEKRIYGLN